MDRTGPRGSHADANLTGPLGVAAGHEGRHLFVPHLDEPRVVLSPMKCPQDSIDAVARIPVDLVHSPCAKPFQKEIRGCLCHHSPTLARPSASGCRPEM